jgi:hypothetical protein
LLRWLEVLGDEEEDVEREVNHGGTLRAYSYTVMRPKLISYSNCRLVIMELCSTWQAMRQCQGGKEEEVTCIYPGLVLTVCRSFKIDVNLVHAIMNAKTEEGQFYR